MKRQLLASTCALLLGFHLTVPGAVMTWTGAGDGSSWNDTNNWSESSLPSVTDVVVISDVATNVTITANGNVVVQTLQCNGSLTLSAGGLQLSGGDSYVTGDLSLATNGYLRVDGSNSTLLVAGAARIDGASLYAFGGAKLQLAALPEYHYDGSSPSWMSDGFGSRLVLPQLTNVISSGGNWLNLLARAGGSIEVTNLVSTRDCYVNGIADGPGSLVDLTRWRFFGRAMAANAYASVSVSDGGAILVPALSDEARVSLSYGRGGLIPVVPFTRLSGLWVDGQELSLPGVTNVDGASLHAINGACVTLPALNSYNALCGHPIWEVDGAHSRLVLPGLARIQSVGCNWLNIYAHNGGSVELTNLVSTLDAYLYISANGPGSLVDLSAWRDFQRALAPSACVAIGVYSGGTVLVPMLNDDARVSLFYSTGGSLPGLPFTRLAGLWVERQTVSLPGVTNVDGASLTAVNGGVLSLPDLAHYDPLCTRPIWEANGAGSRLVLSGLTNIRGTGCSTQAVQAVNGGSLELTNLVSITNSSLTLLATGAGSCVNLSQVTHLAVNPDRSFTATAEAGGQIDFHRLESLSGSVASLLADGPGSLLDLSSLGAFTSPLGASSLTGQNGGSVRLASSAFLIQNVALNIAANPVLPSSAPAGESLALYGKAWHSYRIDVTDTRVPDSSWQFLRRVPQTNDVQVVAGPPEIWQAFRAYEFLADPPILELNPSATGALQPVLYGLTHQLGRIESANELGGSLTSWSLWAETGEMTNSFRIFPAFSPLEPSRYFRGVAVSGP